MTAIDEFSHENYENREDTLNHERRLNREMRNRIGEAFGELAWEAQQVFSETSEQVDRRWRLPDILAYERDHPGHSVKA